jgi:voltage-gated potassium channel
MLTRAKDYLVAFGRTFRELGLHRLIIVVLGLVALGALGLWATEPQVDITNAMWWSIVTLTTVGYGDISPATQGGRLVGAVLMILGIGVLGAFTGQVASLLTERKRLKEKGLLVESNLSDHIIFSGWSSRARAVLDTLRADERGAKRKVVLIAERDEAPVRDKNLTFIQGKTNNDTLRRANVGTADTVICFADPAVDEESRDAKVVLHLLTVESLNPDAYTIAEVELASSIEHCRHANADEVIVGSEFTSHLMSRASLDHGISNVVSEMMNPRTGVEIFKVPLERSMDGEPFSTVLRRVKEEHDCIVLGVETRDNGQPTVLTNPNLARTMHHGEHLIVIGEEGKHRLEFKE